MYETRLYLINEIFNTTNRNKIKQFEQFFEIWDKIDDMGGNSAFFTAQLSQDLFSISKLKLFVIEKCMLYVTAGSSGGVIHDEELEFKEQDEVNTTKVQ